MKKFNIFLDLLTVEIAYSYGHLYWDRCGQTVFDVETQCDGWFSMRDPKNVGRLENPESDMTLVFTDRAFNVSKKKPQASGNDSFGEEVQRTWKIVRANFGLEEYNRLGCRFHFLKPTGSLEESEKFIQNSELNITIPDYLKANRYVLNIRQVVAIFEKEDIEYRLELKGITRSESIDPTSLYRRRPDTLPRAQRRYRLLKMKQLKEYSTNPMYAVMLDIDCVKYNPEQVLVREYIKQQIDIVRSDFLPILEKL